MNIRSNSFAAIWTLAPGPRAAISGGTRIRMPDNEHDARWYGKDTIAMLHGVQPVQHLRHQGDALRQWLGMRNASSRRMVLLPNTSDLGAIVFPRPHTVKKCRKDSRCGGGHGHRDGCLKAACDQSWSALVPSLPPDEISAIKLTTPFCGIATDLLERDNLSRSHR
jgi:hypothetical protein